MRQQSVLGFFVLPPIAVFVSWNGRAAWFRLLSTDLPEEERTGIGLRLRLLYKLIAELPEMDRILISLELEDVRQAEIARITGLSEGNVRVRIHRIKALLTKKIRAYEE